MNFFILQIVLHAFILAGIILSLTGRKSKEESEDSGKKKLLFYYLIVQVVFFSMINQSIFVVMAVMIAILGARELARIKSAFLIWLAYMTVCTLFILFSLEVPLRIIQYVYLGVVLFDYFSEVGGRLWGRTALIPSVSPGKTIQGLFSGVISIQVLSCTLFFLSFFPAKVFVLLNIVMISAFTGDFLASLVKRLYGIKDYDNYLPAQGGILDRFDSFLFAGAMSYILYSVGY